MEKRELLELFDKNIKAKFSFLPSHLKSMSVHNVGHVIRIDSGLSSNMFNILCCEGRTERSAVQTAVQLARSKQLPYAFWIGFEQDPDWLEEELLALGLITEETEWALHCDLLKQDTKGKKGAFDIRRVHAREGVQDIIRVMHGLLPSEEHVAIQSFYEQSAPVLLKGNCPLTFFVGYVDKKPISLSSCYCDYGLASLFDVIVLPEMRGQGLGIAMTAQGMLHAQEKGFDNCILTATNDAKFLYQKLGFKELKTLKVYQEPS